MNISKLENKFSLSADQLDRVIIL
jgi:hypothetical protein